MKDFLKTYLGFLGLAIYYVLALVIRIPVYFVLVFFVATVNLIVDPIMGRNCSYDWICDLHDWYCGR